MRPSFDGDTSPIIQTDRAEQILLVLRSVPNKLFRPIRGSENRIDLDFFIENRKRGIDQVWTEVEHIADRLYNIHTQDVTDLSCRFAEPDKGLAIATLIAHDQANFRRIRSRHHTPSRSQA